MASVPSRCFLIAAITILSTFQLGNSESVCHKKPRPPPAGCCPANYVGLCCPVAGDNETIQSCVKTKSSRPPAMFPFDERKACVHSWRTQACAGGFYLDPVKMKPAPCPKGFYCPEEVLCIIPCPSGAYCVPKKKIQSNRCKGFGVCCDDEPPLVLSQNQSRTCNGVNDTKCLCGGPSVPQPCPGGYYCPQTDIKKPCQSGHYCRPGSTSPDPCPFLAKCGKRASAPIVNFIAPLLDLIILLLFVGLYFAYQHWRTIKFYYNLYFARITSRERSSTQAHEIDAGIFHSTGRLGELIKINEEIEPKTFTIDISFQNLGLTLSSGENKGKVVLQGVTGHVRSGEVTAVMGPSGAGKTTFLNTLSGKAYYGTPTGKILFNDEEVRGIKEYRSITGFVPQEDTMYRNLTVSEVLYYQAVLRLSSGTSSREIRHKIRQVLNILDIGHVSDSLIGDETRSGEIKFNGHKVEGIDDFRSITGFVPLEDTMHRNLTVGEVLYYQAALRLRSGTSNTEMMNKVDQVLETLDIRDVKDSIIGDEETGGISRGQRKRVNIGMELVANPTLLFLDEPTSGLDSVTSWKIMNSLKNLTTERSLTVVCVIHQPSLEIFNLFDNILLLGRGGRTVYHGSVEVAQKYFFHIGYDNPCYINPAEYYMKVIAGTVKPNEENQHCNLFDTFKEWRNKNPPSTDGHRNRGNVDLFQKIFSLGCEGHIVYHCSVDDAQPYCSTLLDKKCKKIIDPAEHYMLVIVGKEWLSLLDSFKQRSLKPRKEKNSSNNDKNRQDASVGEEGSSLLGSSEQPSFVARRVPPAFCFQLWYFFKRELVLLKRSVKTLFIDAVLVITAGVILGLLYIEVQLEKFSGLARMSGMAIGLTSVIASLRCFGNHRTIFWRESAAGVNRVSYFLAVNLAQLPFLIIMPLVYMGVLHPLTSPRSSFLSPYLAVVCAQLCCSGMGYAISTILKPKSSQMASVVVVLIMALVSGFSPTLCSLDELSFFGPLVYNLSYIRWFVEALFEKEALRYPDVLRPIRDEIAFPDHYTLENYSLCVTVIVAMAVAYRLLALLCLLFTNRRKQSRCSLSDKLAVLLKNCSQNSHGTS